MLGKVTAETEMRGLRSTRCVRGTIRRPLGLQEAPNLVDGVGSAHGADQEGLPDLAHGAFFWMQWGAIEAF